MKKALLIGIFFGGLALTSCKKNWLCECYYQGTLEESYVIANKSKNKAKKQCKNQVNIGAIKVAGNENCDVRQ